MKVFQKQPNDHLDYDIDLSDWLSEGDRIQSLDMTSPEGISVTGTGYSDKRVKVWVEGGTSGESYKFSVLVYTNTRIKEVDFMIVVVEM